MEVGTITFLFTDVEGSTKLWEQYPEAMKAVLARHDAILQETCEANHGRILKSMGDGCMAVFETATSGAVAAVAAQQTLAAEQWGGIRPQTLRVRMALHTGEAEIRAGDYFGPAVNRAARLMSIGYGGQILLSASTVDLVRDHLPASLALLDLGEHRLKDLVRPEHVFQLAGPGLTAEFPPLKSLDAFPNNLPMQLTRFVGREREMAEAKELLWMTRLLTLVGPGGTGKTRLGLQVAAEVLPSFSDGVWLVELAPLADPALIPQSVAQTFDLRDVPGVPILSLVTDYLRAKHLLLILDNCEHLVEPSARLADHLLRACPHIKIVASSREALGIAGETVYRVPSLSLPDPTHVTRDDLARSESVELFVERARAVQPRFGLDDRNAPAIAQLCQRLDGIPLALELAAARIKLFSPEQIASRLDDRFRLLTGGSRTALPRQQTLRALIDWSYDLLSEAERALLRRLSVFANGWTFEAAEAVGGDLDVLDLMEQLVNKSLVIVEETEAGERRYRLLETIRQYARDKLYELGEATAARDRHLDYFVRLGEESSPHLRTGGMVAWLDRLEPESDNIRAALEWGLEDRPEDALALLANLSSFLLWRTFHAEALHWLRESLDRVAARPTVEEHASDRQVSMKALVTTVLGQLEMQRGEIATAAPILREAVALARAAGDLFVLGYSLDVLAVTYVFLNDIPASHAAAEECLAVARQSGDQVFLLLALSTLLWTASARGDQAAIEVLGKQIRPAVPSGDHPLAAYALLGMGSQARWRGDLDAARLYLEQGLTMSARLRSKQYEASIRSELAHVSRQSGDYAAAQEGYRQTMLLWKDLGHRAAIANELECLGFIARGQGQLHRAARFFGAAEVVREASGAPMTVQEQAEYEREVAGLQAEMDESAFATEWAEGRAMTMEQAIAYALEQIEPH